ncbi:restriction endonuclease subunit S [Mixta calida]|uniref:restriction endonuclease subunit S n=1 Tax=Mixta calida TaxID=665913 RepID=UPI0016438F0B|nr:restriction endonuclease subunit S [Mixta calida]
MSEFDIYQLENLAEITSSKRIFYSDYVDAGVPFYRSKEIIEIHNNKSVSNELFISKEKFLEISNKFGAPVEGDILLTSVGTLGIPYLVRKGDNFYFKDGNLTWIRKINRTKVLPEYIYRFLRSPYGKSKIEEITIGSTQPALTISGLKTLTLSIPSLVEQQAIVSVLSSLDDKIDLLHRQNKTLESMANTLFRQWFIKEAQDDWVEGTLSSIASNVRENVTKQNIPSEALYVGLEHIDRRNIALLKNGNGSDVDSNKSKFSTGDILFGKLRPYFHKVCTAPFDGICSTDILVIRPKNHNLQCFCLFAFFQDEVIEFANIASGGTRMPRIDWTSLANYPISLPPDDKLNDFEKIVSIQVRRINFNVHKIKNLENLRDTLLPKLMSGEVRVQYAEEAIASVA